jgi:hypothetical protein
MKTSLRQRIFCVSDGRQFDETALEIFRYQASENQVYKLYISSLGVSVSEIKTIEAIPFMPVSFFKDHKIITGKGNAESVFESSGTTGSLTSRHYVTDLSLYRESFFKGFEKFYGNPAEYLFTALLPSYAERENSSLIYMMKELIDSSRYKESGFYNNDKPALIEILGKSREKGLKRILLGVSFALLDLAEEFGPDLAGITVIETGGMKGRRKEITREELHTFLSEKLNVKSIHSEYGMTELLSQAWSSGNGLFTCPPWMKVLIRDTHDPLRLIEDPGVTGGINIIDFANLNSCSFLAVNDLGRINTDGTFEILGRFDNSDTRGCNLLVV